MNVLRRTPLLIALLLAEGSSHATGVNIGIVAPQDGNFASLGAQITTGANFQLQAQQDSATVVNEPCTEDGGRAAAESLITAKAQVAIGFLCTETLAGALPRLKEAGIPVITVSVRSHIVMEDALKNGWPLFRLAPVDSAEASMAADVILKNWVAEPIALIEDGTIHGRELVEVVRNSRSRSSAG